MSRDTETERRIDADQTGLRLAWFLSAFHVAGYNEETKLFDGPHELSATVEALWNVIRWRPATHWRNGVKLIRVYEDDE